MFQGVPAWTLTAVALIVGYCQVLTWQVRIAGLSVPSARRAWNSDRLCAVSNPPCLLAPASDVHPCHASPCACPPEQGLWQEAAVGWLGGSRDPLALLDPAALDLSVQQSMGSLVGVTQLPAFLIAPAAAVLTGVLEASFFAGGHAVRSSVR